MLDAIGAGLAPRIGNKDWGEIWNESPEAKIAKEEIIALKTEALARSDSQVTEQESKCEHTPSSCPIATHMASRCYPLLPSTQDCDQA